MQVAKVGTIDASKSCDRSGKVSKTDAAIDMLIKTLSSIQLHSVNKTSTRLGKVHSIVGEARKLGGVHWIGKVETVTSVHKLGRDGKASCKTANKRKVKMIFHDAPSSLISDLPEHLDRLYQVRQIFVANDESPVQSLVFSRFSLDKPIFCS